MYSKNHWKCDFFFYLSPSLFVQQNDCIIHATEKENNWYKTICAYKLETKGRQILAKEQHIQNNVWHILQFACDICIIMYPNPNSNEYKKKPSNINVNVKCEKKDGEERLIGQYVKRKVLVYIRRSIFFSSIHCFSIRPTTKKNTMKNHFSVKKLFWCHFN